MESVIEQRKYRNLRSKEKQKKKERKQETRITRNNEEQPLFSRRCPISRGNLENPEESTLAKKVFSAERIR